jgi:tetratricopeptide (TPR) repeat protein
MGTESEEIDYLVETKPYPKIPSFADEVRDAYALEHRCLHDQDIADRLQVTPGRVSQILKHPRTLKAETVQKIVSGLSSVVHRRNILKAWQRECFGEELSEQGSSSLIGNAPTEVTVKRIDRLVRTYRPDRALKVTEQALTFPVAPELRAQLLDRAYYLYQRLDLPAHALDIADAIFAEGRGVNEHARMAVGLAMKARTLNNIDGADFNLVKALHEQVLSILDLVPDDRRSTTHLAVDKRTVRTEGIGHVLKYHERFGGAEDFLRSALRDIQTSAGETDSTASVSLLLQTEARIYLALKDYFKAEDILDEMFEAGSATLGSSSRCGIIKARIMAARGSIEEAIDYYEKLCTLCESRRQLYLYRLSHRDLAILKASESR